jgi:ribose transport system substrate-binding protein
MTKKWFVAPKVSRRDLLISVPAIAIGLGNAKLFAATSGKQLVYGYVTPGPDTWYKRDVDGFVYAAEKAGAKVVVLNSDYNAEKEIANIDSLINQGVDGMAIFTFNPNGANIAAKKCADAKIPLVATDNVGQVLKSGHDVVAAIDFDWSAMGKDVANYIAQNYPGENIAVIMGLFEHIPVQMFRAAFEPAVADLGKNKIVAVRDGRYDPNEAVNQAQDLIQSGQKFSVLFVFNDEMGVAVVRMLKTRGLLNNPIKVITTNGAPYGIEAMKDGGIKYSVSSSPGWEGMISFLALHAYVTGKITTKNQQILLPIAPITPATIDDKTKVIPWDVDPVWLQLTKTNFPQYTGLY